MDLKYKNRVKGDMWWSKFDHTKFGQLR